MFDYVEFSEADVIYYNTLIFQRWPLVHEDEVRRMIVDSDLPAYRVRRKLDILPDDQVVYSCTADVNEKNLPPVKWTPSSWKRIVFRLNDIERLEGIHQDFLWTREPTEDREQLETQSINVSNNCDAISIGKCDERLRKNNKTIALENMRLEDEVSALRLELKAERARAVAAELPGKEPRTAAATKMASIASVKEWKVFAAVMVKVAFECSLEGPMPRKRPQLQAMAKRHGEGLSDGALNVLRDALPGDHISREPGASRQD